MSSILEASDVRKELVQDADALSNTAILMIPVMLTLLPLGLFQQVTILTAILYCIATDFISVLPLLIKVAELVHTGNERFRSLYGSLEFNKSGMIQIWTAECTVNSHIRTKGGWYLGLGFAAMILGIILEVATMVMTRSEKAKLKAETEVLLRSDAPESKIRDIYK